MLTLIIIQLLLAILLVILVLLQGSDNEGLGLGGGGGLGGMISPSQSGPMTISKRQRATFTNSTNEKRKTHKMLYVSKRKQTRVNK